MGKFELNYNKLIFWLNHPHLTKSNLYDFIRALIAPISQLKSFFDKFKKSISYKIMITGQVVYLERALNDEFDYNERRIFIEDIYKQPSTNLYDRADWDQLADSEKVYLYDRNDEIPQNLYDRDSGADAGGFVIHVPFMLSEQQRIKMHALVRYYKLPGKNYMIIENA
jgi:hypothetical protein